MTPKQEQQIEAFVSAARQYTDSVPGTCICGVRLASLVLRKWHFRVQPLSVTVHIYNAAYIAKGREPKSDEEAFQWREEGVWSIELGARGIKRPGGWPGHLVAILNGNAMLDLTLNQACRPNKGIVLEPIIGGVSKDFLVGKELAEITTNGCQLIYQPFPDDKSFILAGDWRSNHENAVRRITELMCRKIG